MCYLALYRKSLPAPELEESCILGYCTGCTGFGGIAVMGSVGGGGQRRETGNKGGAEMGGRETWGRGAGQRGETPAPGRG